MASTCQYFGQYSSAQQAYKAFPDLEDYSACWPVHDLIQMRLKYTSGRARLSQRMGARNVKDKKKS